jgi:hypothetical protein
MARDLPSIGVGRQGRHFRLAAIERERAAGVEGAA